MSTRTPPPKSGQVRQAPWAPRPVQSIQDTGLNIGILTDLAIKIMYFGGYVSGNQIAELMHLPFTNVVQLVMEDLKREKFVEVRGGGGLGAGAFEYVVTLKGIEKAHEAMARTQYAGPCPVTLDQYVNAMKSQSRAKVQRQPRNSGTGADRTRHQRRDVRARRSGGELRQGHLHVRPARQRQDHHRAGCRQDDPRQADVDSLCRSTWTGRSSACSTTSITRSSTAPTDARRASGTGERLRPRWVRIRRPVIMVGGELTLETLDLVYDPINKYYEAPFQMKANGGMFLIDDFGRQQVRPRDLLNRWIVPLESRMDFLTLPTGRKIEIPFNVLIVFTTNMPPARSGRRGVFAPYPAQDRSGRSELRGIPRDFQAYVRNASASRTTKKGWRICSRNGTSSSRSQHARCPSARHHRADHRHLALRKYARPR